MNEGVVARYRNLSRGKSVCELALWTAALATPAMPSQAQTTPPVVITIAEPEGFSDLTDERTLLVDVYFGGVQRGQTQVVVTPGSIRIVNPDALVAMLPELADRELVHRTLANQALAANSELACGQGVKPPQCGRLEPVTVGVIFDRNRFRLEVFLNPRLLAVQENVEEQYLPPAQHGVSFINAMGFTLSGRSDSGNEYYNFFDQLVLAEGERRLRADLTYATEQGLEADRLVAEWDRPGLRFSAGAMWAPGSEIAGRRKLVGVGIESQIDTRLDRDEILGSPIVVYLEQRARVDVVRDGRIYNSAIYEAGNQQVDTSNLPDGSYNILLRIEMPGRPAREESRFFSKSRRLPSVGRTDFFAYAGLLVDDTHWASLKPSQKPYFQGGIARRLSDHWAVAGGIEATDANASVEIAATLLSPLLNVRATAVADLEGAYGGILQVTSSGTSRLNFNFDLRRIQGIDEVAPSPNGPIAPGQPASLSNPSGSYSQAGGVISYGHANLRFLGTAFYRNDEAQVARYSIGPALEWDVLRRGKLTLTMRGDLAITERGNAGFAGVSLRMVGRSSTVTALGGARVSGMTGDELGEGAVGALSGSWSPHVAGGDLSIGAGLEHHPRQDDYILSGEFRHPYGTLAGDLVHSDGPLSPVTQYSLGFQTTFVAGAGAMQVAGKTTTESMIVARVNGARENDRFEVLVNEQIAGTIYGRDQLALALPTYRAYDVRIRPIGESLLAYDATLRRIGLYPGTLARLEWKVAPVTIKFGRLVTPAGAPIARASITGEGVWSETDSEGYFQIEVPEEADLTITLSDGRSYGATLPTGEEHAGIARIGSVVCCSEKEVRLGALTLDPIDGESQ